MKIEQQIYTSCPHGEGYDRISGFQVKARSQGISNAVSRAILRYSNHYHMPHHLRTLEYQYYREGKDLPPEFLAQLPIAVTYHQVDEDLYGLTRICYVGKDYSGRPGNFLAHSLVFPPGALKPFQYNPLALARSSLFHHSQTSGIEMESLADLQPYAPPDTALPQGWMSKVTAGPYADSYEGVLSALVRGLCRERPFIFCFNDQAHALDYIENLLMMLPPSMRCRFTFTTYEPEPYTLLTNANHEETFYPLHLVTTITLEQGGTFDYRPHHLQQFLVHDFPGKRSSTFPGPSPYTGIVIKLCAGNRSDRLETHQKFLEQIGAGMEPGTWDALIQAEEWVQGRQLDESPQVAAAVLSAITAVAHTESQVTRALEPVGLLLEKTAHQEKDELFPAVLHAFSQLHARLPEESAKHSEIEKQLVKLTVASVAAGNLSRAGQLANIEPKLLEQTTQILWEKVKSSCNADGPDNDFSRWLVSLVSFKEKLPPDSALSRQVTEQAGALVYSLLKKGFAVRALRLLELTGQEEQEVLPGIYRQLVEEGWPAGLSPNRASLDHNREAFRTIMEVVVKEMLTDETSEGNLLQAFIPALKMAHIYEFADHLWKECNKRLWQELSEPANPATAVDFLEEIIGILAKYQCEDDVFRLLSRQSELQMPQSFKERQQQMVKLTRQLLRCHEPNRHTNDLLNFIAPSLDHREQALLLAVIFAEAAGYAGVRKLIKEKYHALLAGLPEPGSAWDIRLALAQQGEPGWHLLMQDFTAGFKPWPEKGRELLQDWEKYIFSPNPRFISFAAAILAETWIEPGGSRQSTELNTAFLELWGTSHRTQCMPLWFAYIIKTPLEIVYANRKPWFSQAPLPHTGYSCLKERIAIMALVEKIEKAVAKDKPDGQKYAGFLKQWQKLRLDLDTAAQDWATGRLLELFGTIDFFSMPILQKPVKQCLQKYQPNDLRPAVNHLCHQWENDSVTQVLMLAVIIRTGVNHLAESGSRILAELAFHIAKVLPAKTCQQAWKLSAERAAAHEPPFTEALRQFQRMTKPAAHFGRLGRHMLNQLRMLNQLFKREDGETKMKKKTKKGKAGKNKKKK
jgi:hypothetical protein